MSLKGKQLVLSFFFLLFFVKIEMMGQVINNSGKFEEGNVERKSSFNIEEIKVRWKKAALENCTGVPCVSTIAPGVPTGVVATAGNASASVAFVAPSNTGGSAITGYTVTSSPGSITAMGTTSPINVTGLTNGTPYTFTIVATNAVGNSLASSASPAVIPAPSFTCGTSTISDIDGNTYNTVLIGMQCWTKENLKVTKYNDNTSITLNNTYTAGTVSTVWRNYITGAYTIFDNESSTGMNASNYGYLYNWYAASDSRKLCPTGWHVPIDAEWTALETQLGGPSVAGTVMKDTSNLWLVSTPPSPGTNTSGFSALPGGYRDRTGEFNNVRADAVFWSATARSTTEAWLRYLVAESGRSPGASNFGSNYGRTQVGAEVRCLKD